MGNVTDLDRTEVLRIVEECLDQEEGKWLLSLDRIASASNRQRFESMVDRRRSGEPLQYVLGHWSFRTLELEVGPGVLIPRPETEHVAGLAIEELRRVSPRRGARAADLGTGSGAVALSLAKEAGSRHPGLEVWATDVSEEALQVARRNAVAMLTPSCGTSGTTLTFATGSWYEALPPELVGSFDLVVSNPPYLSRADLGRIEPVVAEWEPHVALVAGPSGIEAVEALVVGARRWLRRGGSLVVEIAPHQRELALQFAADAGFASFEVVGDLTGRDRCLIARAAS